MNNDIQTLNAEANEISGYLQTTLQGSPEEIQQRMADTMAYVARTGEMLAQAKRLLRRRKSEEIQNTILRIARENCLSAKVQNALLDSIAEDEAFLVDTLDRLNAAATHQLDALRTLLSYEREGLRLNKTGY